MLGWLSFEEEVMAWWGSNMLHEADDSAGAAAKNTHYLSLTDRLQIIYLSSAKSGSVSAKSVSVVLH